MKKLIWFVLVLLALLAAAFAIFRVPDTDAEAMRAKYGAEPSQYVKLENGLTVHLRDEGAPGDANNPAIILLHGSNADLHVWEPWVEALKSDYRVIRYDQRGHGLTGPAPDHAYSITAFAEDVGRVADALDLETFVLGGNSMGGAIAMEYALADPDRLEGLVLVDAGGAPVRNEGSGALGFQLAQIPGLNRVFIQMLPRELIEKSFRQSVSNEAIVTDAAIDRYWELARYPGNRDATIRRFAQAREPFIASEIEQFAKPTLIIWGEDDQLVPFAGAGWFGEHLPNSTLVSYAGIGHLPMEEAPERSASDLKNWLETLAPAALTEMPSEVAANPR